MGKGTNTTTNQTTSAPAPQAQQAYLNLLNQAGNVAQTPYQAYSGQLTAPVNSQQQAGISGINQSANFAQPAVNQAIGIAGNAANPLTQQQIQQYQNPYTQDVVNATQAQFNNQNAQQQAGVTGNAISQGALGGNRVGVAQANLAGQQQLAQAPVIAGLYNQSYQQGLSTAENQFQQNPLAAAGSLANFGISGQGAALSGAGAQLGAGTLEQQTQQAQDAAAYQQYAQQQAYPFQTTQWLAGLDTGVGSQLGGTSSGQTTGPAPNQTAQDIGLGLSAAGLFLSDRRAKEDIHKIGSMHDGQPLYRYRYKGSPDWHIGPMAQDVEKDHPEAVHHGVGGAKYVDLKAATEDSIKRASGGGVSGTPWSEGQGWVPTINITGGHGAPSASAPSVAAQPAFDPSKLASGISGLKGGLSGPAYGGGNILTDAYGGSSSNPLPGLDASDYGAGFKRGGVVGYADGGSPDFSDMFASDVDALALARPGVNRGIAPQPTPGSQGAPTYDDGQGPVPMYGQRPVGDKQSLKGTGVAPSPDGDVEQPDDAAPISEPGTSPGGPSGVAPAAGFTPPYQITPADYAAPTRDERGGIFGVLSPNASSGLLSAGLGMLASRSPFLGTAIGEGGLTGLSAYGSAEEKDRKAAEDAQKLSLEAKQAANAQALSTYNVNHKGDMTDYQEAEIALEKQKQAQGFKPTWSVISEAVDPDTGLSKKTYGWVDPNKKVITDASGKPIAASTSPAPTSQPPQLGADGKPVTGEGWAATVSPSRADRARMIANYQETPADLPTRGGVRATAVADAKHFNQDYDEQNYAASQRAYNNFVAGPEARSVRSLNVATDHLDTLRDAATALKNGQLPLLNSVVNRYREATGSPLTTNFDSIKQAVSSEIAKVVVGGQTALADRDEMANRARNADSPEQLYGIFDQFTKLMGGQMKGLKQQYETGTYRKDFEKFLLPSTKKSLASVSKDVDATYETPKAPDAAVARLKANPALAPAFDQKYGAGASKQYLGQ